MAEPSQKQLNSSRKAPPEILNPFDNLAEVSALTRGVAAATRREEECKAKEEEQERTIAAQYGSGARVTAVQKVESCIAQSNDVESQDNDPPLAIASLATEQKRLYDAQWAHAKSSQQRLQLEMQLQKQFPGSDCPDRCVLRGEIHSLRLVQRLESFITQLGGTAPAKDILDPQERLRSFRNESEEATARHQQATNKLGDIKCTVVEKMGKPVLEDYKGALESGSSEFVDSKLFTNLKKTEEEVKREREVVEEKRDLLNNAAAKLSTPDEITERAENNAYVLWRMFQAVKDNLDEVVEVYKGQQGRGDPSESKADTQEAMVSNGGDSLEATSSNEVQEPVATVSKEVTSASCKTPTSEKPVEGGESKEVVLEGDDSSKVSMESGQELQEVPSQAAKRGPEEGSESSEPSKEGSKEEVGK